MSSWSDADSFQECAAGIENIHALGYMHRDLKSLNIFMDKNLVAKVADFGMVTDEKVATEPFGTPQWMAPEVLSNYFGHPAKYDNSCDVFSFGILCWEIFHTKVPYAETGLDQIALAKQVIKADIRPTMSRTCPAEIAQLIVACWSRDAKKRPSMKDVTKFLMQIKEKVV